MNFINSKERNLNLKVIFFIYLLFWLMLICIIVFAIYKNNRVSFSICFYRHGVPLLLFFISVELTSEERMFLRVVHLLFRVACPVVRMIFNHEIQPNQLRNTLLINRTGMEKQFRKKEKIINNFQWALLYTNTKGKHKFNVIVKQPDSRSLYLPRK